MWKSQSVQFVWFLAAVADVKTSQIFEALTGEEPSSCQTNRIPNPANPFLAVATGQLGDFVATLQLQPGRLDLILLPREEVEDGPLDEYPTLVTEEAVKLVLERIARLPAISTSVRLAVVLNLFEQAENADAARVILENKIGYTPEIDQYSDFSFQINKLKSLSLGENILMNRLLRYSAMKFQTFSLSQVAGSDVRPVPVTREYIGAALTVDVNTVPHAVTFASDILVPIFEQLAEEALRIAESGEMITLRD